MRISSRFGLSLILNVTLVLVVGGELVSRHARPTVTALDTTTQDAPSRRSQPSSRAQPASNLAASGPLTSRQIIDRLRSMGVPNELLGLFARVGIEANWENRFKACRGDMNKMAAVQLEMNRHKDAEMQAALGEEGFREWDRNYMLWEAMSTKVPVSSAEAASIYALKKKLQSAQFAVEEARLKGTLDDAEINAAYDSAYSEYYANLKAILGDERYAVSQQLDDGFALGNLRSQLANLNPTDSQLKSLLEVEHAWRQSKSELEHQYQTQSDSREYIDRAKALDEAHDLEYQRILGEESFANLQKQQNPAYTQMKKYQALWGLDDAKIENVYATLKAFQSQVQEYQANAAASGSRMGNSPSAPQLQELAAQTEQRLRAYVGDDVYRKLERNRVLPFARNPARNFGAL